MIVLYDTANNLVLEAKDSDDIWWVLNGSCRRCGVCCKLLNCSELKEETLDGDVHCLCLKQAEKPTTCAVFPADPAKELPQSCGFSWSLK